MPEAPTPEAPAEVVPPITTPVAGESTASDPEAPVPGEEALGDPGKKALDAMKAAKREAEQKARETQAKLDEALAKIAGTEAEYKAEQERRKVEDAALAKANERILKAEIRAAAAGKLTDPADALHYLDLTGFQVGDDGEVDRAAVTAAIESLVKSKPYLAAQGGATPPPTVFETPSAHRTEAPGQLTQADLKGMTPDQINAARAEGRLNKILGIPL